MELTYYLFILLVSIIIATKKTIIKNSNVFFIIWISIYIVLSTIIRLNFQADIITYSEEMKSSSLSLYYLKEPVVWLGQRLLYDLTGSSYQVLFIYDFIAGIILFISLRNIKVPQYIFFTILLFFPFILGMQNIYRQWFASILLLYSLSTKDKSNGLSLIAFALSVLSHNATAIFLPLVFLKEEKPINIKVIVLIIISMIGMYIGSNTKSSADTGAELSKEYIVLILLLYAIHISLERMKHYSSTHSKTFLIIFGISTLSTILLDSAGSERISMIGLLIIYPLLSISIENIFKPAPIARVFYGALGFIPILLFSTIKFLLP